MDDLRPVDVDEVRPDLVGDGAGKEGLSRSRRSRKQDPFGWIDPQLCKQFGKLKGKFDHLPHVAQFDVQTSDVLVGRAGRFLMGEIGGSEGEGRVGVYPHTSPGAQPLDDEKLGPGPEENDLNPVTHDHVKPRQEVPDMGDLLILGDGRAGFNRSEEDRVGSLEGHLGDGDPLVQGNLGVVPSDPVNLNKFLAGVISGELGGAGHC